MRKNNPDYIRWSNMMKRCYESRHVQYRDWGGRGIRVCERWHNFDNYVLDINALGEKPTLSHTLDRINNDGDYELSNIRWATKQEQALNKRTYKNNTSGHPGIYWYKRDKKWLLCPTIKGKVTYLGYFTTLKEAISIKEKYV